MSGNAEIFGKAKMSGNSVMSGNAAMYDNARLYGNARMSDNAEMFGDGFSDCLSGVMFGYFKARTGTYGLTLTLRGDPDNVTGVNWNWGCKQGVDLRKYLKENPDYGDLAKPVLMFLEMFETMHKDRLASHGKEKEKSNENVN